MARARNIKPGFFRNPELVDLPFETRLLFPGLWILADREGRLKDRPKQIKMEIFPADSLDINVMLDQLADAGLIVRYEVYCNSARGIFRRGRLGYHHSEDSCWRLNKRNSIRARDRIVVLLTPFVQCGGGK